jgi:DNA primase
MSEKRYGSHSLHVIAPLRTDTGFNEVRELARGMATPEQNETRSPGLTMKSGLVRRET